jgi:methionyl-tRNA synthetase
MKYFISTAIDYPSSKPHIGHLYEKVCADTIARWKRLKGYDVHFSTGVDCHGKKIQRKAEQAGKTPKEFVLDMAKYFVEMCRLYDVSYDDFISTTEPRHHKVVQQLFEKIQKNGDVYKGYYEGHYCVECETYYGAGDLAEGCCPVHTTKKIEWLKEESYFFKMSNYQKKLIDFIKKNPQHIQPSARRNELLNRLSVPLKDLSISRASFDWGIQLPNDKKHVFYVWLDALTNYLTTVDYPNAKYKKFWPADMHLIGKDIVWHHTAIWWSLLMSAGIEVPKVYGHGFIKDTKDPSGKISKSKGNTADTTELAEKYGTDVVRYFLLREIPFGDDGIYSEAAIVNRNNNELANELGNLVNRTIILIEKNLSSKIPDSKSDKELSSKLDAAKIEKLMENNELNSALAEIFAFVGECNRYVNAKEPWRLKGKELEVVLYTLADSLRIISILISPFMPKTSSRVNEQLGVKAGTFKDVKPGLLKAGTKVKPTGILFKKLEYKEALEEAREIGISIDPKLKTLGLKLVCAVVEGASVKKKHEGLEKIKKDSIKKIDLGSVEEQKVIQGYLDLYDLIGVKRDTHAVKNLVELAKKSGNIPQINTVVDSYNLVSLKYGVIVGAHDISKISGNVKVKFAEGNELYVPLGQSEKAQVAKGEYVFVDDKVVLCRLDVKQGEHTKVDNATKNVFIYVQGNKNTPQKYIEDAMKEILSNIEKYCGGKARIVVVS